MHSPLRTQELAHLRAAAGPLPVRKMSSTPVMTAIGSASATPAASVTGHASTHFPQRTQASTMASTRPASAVSNGVCVMALPGSETILASLLRGRAAGARRVHVVGSRPLRYGPAMSPASLRRMNPTFAISFAGVSKRFARPGGRTLDALDRVSFEVPSGEIVAILGPSGSGKTTLLNLAAGLAVADEGRVEVMGRDTEGAVDWSEVGYMFQDDRLLPWRVAIRNVTLALEAGDMTAPERRARALAGLELVGLADFADSYPHQLSGGMRSRVALARSLVGEPEILLMDEPFSRLDAQTRSAMHGELLRIHALRRMSILFVTHDVEEAVILADRIVTMSPRPGRVGRQVSVALPQPRLDRPDSMELVAALRAGLADTEIEETSR